MIRLLLLAAVFLVPFRTQTAEPPLETTLVPQTVYVGDRARLIVLLEGETGASGNASTVIDRAEHLPSTENVRIHRVEIDRRQGRVRAYIDFTAFAPGSVALPAIDAEGVRLAGLEVRVASVLEANATELSPPESSLTAPGTYLLIYGGIFLLLGVAGIVLFFAVRGLPLLRAYLERRKRDQAARSMRRVIGRLEADGGKMDGALLLSVLFDELRSYLTYRTGLNCHALTPREFPVVLSESASKLRFSDSDLAFLGSLFRRGDEVRFGSHPTTYGELMEALRGVGELVERMEASSC
jgi:hypothetical protein